MSSPLTSPPGDFMFGSPPDSLIINLADEGEYLRAAFRVWVTELRPRWIARWHGCAATHIESDKQLMRAACCWPQLDVPLLPLSPGSWTFRMRRFRLIQDERPFLVHLRLLQEWALSGIAGAVAAPGGGGSDELVLPAETQTVTNVDGPATIDIKEEQVVIATALRDWCG